MDNYEILVYNPARTQLLTRFSGFATLDYVLNDKDIGALTLVIPPIVPVEFFTQDTQIEVWRTNFAGVPVLEGGTQWFVERITNQYAAERLYTIEAIDAIGLLNRRAVLWKAGSTQTTKTAAADDMMKAVMRENFPSVVVLDPYSAAFPKTRDLANILTDDFYNPLVSIAADQTLLPVISASFAWDKLLSVLQVLASTSEAASVFAGFRFVQTNTVTGAMEFRTYANSTGPDRRAIVTGQGVVRGVVLTLENGALSEASVIEDFTNTVTAVLAGGEGEEDRRAVGGSTERMKGPWSYKEEFVEKTDTSDVFVLNDYAAGVRIPRQHGRRQLLGTINETSDIQYGRDFGLGYYVTAEVGGFLTNCRVAQIAVNVTQGNGESITATIVSDDEIL